MKVSKDFKDKYIPTFRSLKRHNNNRIHMNTHKECLQCKLKIPIQKSSVW
jgi:hypothetical protein